MSQSFFIYFLNFFRLLQFLRRRINRGFTIIHGDVYYTDIPICVIVVVVAVLRSVHIIMYIITVAVVIPAYRTKGIIYIYI